MMIECLPECFSGNNRYSKQCEESFSRKEDKNTII